MGSPDRRSHLAYFWLVMVDIQRRLCVCGCLFGLSRLCVEYVQDESPQVVSSRNLDLSIGWMGY